MNSTLWNNFFCFFFVLFFVHVVSVHLAIFLFSYAWRRFYFQNETSHSPPLSWLATKQWLLLVTWHHMGYILITLWHHDLVAMYPTISWCHAHRMQSCIDFDHTGQRTDYFWMGKNCGQRKMILILRTDCFGSISDVFGSNFTIAEFYMGVFMCRNNRAETWYVLWRNISFWC